MWAYSWADPELYVKLVLDRWNTTVDEDVLSLTFALVGLQQFVRWLAARALDGRAGTSYCPSAGSRETTHRPPSRHASAW